MRRPNKVCLTCRWWFTNRAECRRNPPQIMFAAVPVARPARVITGPQDTQTEMGFAGDQAWPTTMPGEWCGEWKGADNIDARIRAYDEARAEAAAADSPRVTA